MRFKLLTLAAIAGSAVRDAVRSRMCVQETENNAVITARVNRLNLMRNRSFRLVKSLPMDSGDARNTPKKSSCASRLLATIL